jgi:mycofactocin biosynthesis protein MftB
VSTDLKNDLLGRSLELHPQAAVRPEPFGALVYHYGNRRLVFLQHTDMVTVANSLSQHATLADALAAAGVDSRRWPSFVTAFESLMKSDVVRERTTDER